MMETIQHKLEQFDPGMVWLDSGNRIVAMNAVAMETFGTHAGEMIGEDVLQLHPESSRDKVKWLLDQTLCAAKAPPPMTMMINIPERVLLIKVSRMTGLDGQFGACMVFYDLTDLAVAAPDESSEALDAAEPQLQLHKLPVYKDKRVLLVSLESVCCIKADGRYSTLYADSENYFCNLSLSELEKRLDRRFFFRVHRSHLINMRYAKAFEKVGEQCYLIMEYLDGMKIPISRSKINSLKQLLGLA